MLRSWGANSIDDPCDGYCNAGETEISQWCDTSGFHDPVNEMTKKDKKGYGGLFSGEGIGSIIVQGCCRCGGILQGSWTVT